MHFVLESQLIAHAIRGSLFVARGSQLGPLRILMRTWFLALILWLFWSMGFDWLRLVSQIIHIELGRCTMRLIWIVGRSFWEKRALQRTRKVIIALHYFSIREAWGLRTDGHVVLELEWNFIQVTVHQALQLLGIKELRNQLVLVGDYLLKVIFYFLELAVLTHDLLLPLPAIGYFRKNAADAWLIEVRFGICFVTLTYLRLKEASFMVSHHSLDLCDEPLLLWEAFAELIHLLFGTKIGQWLLILRVLLLMRFL